MLLLLICSVVSLTVILLRATALRRSAVLPEVLVKSVENIPLEKDNEAIESLSSLVRGERSALGRVIEIGISHLSWPKSENVEAVQTRARHEVVRLESGLIVLEVIVGIAPLLGLLGTVSGLVSVFATLGATEGAADPRAIATGIAEALNTTIVGLAIAVPSLIAYSYFSKKVETMATEMESMTADLLAKCYHQQNKITARPASHADKPSEVAAEVGMAAGLMERGRRIKPSPKKQAVSQSGSGALETEPELSMTPAESIDQHDSGGAVEDMQEVDGLEPIPEAEISEQQAGRSEEPKSNNLEAANPTENAATDDDSKGNKEQPAVAAQQFVKESDEPLTGNSDNSEEAPDQVEAAQKADGEQPEDAKSDQRELEDNELGDEEPRAEQLKLATDEQESEKSEKPKPVPDTQSDKRE